MKKDELDLLIKNGYLQSAPDDQLLQKELGALVDDGFLEQLPNHFFSFDSNLTWEVVYETLLYAERRRLHDIVAKHIEKHNEGNLSAVADMLLYHFEKANDINKCILYACIAADRAAELYANNDAINYYKRALAFLNSKKRTASSDSSLIYERIGDAFDIIGDHKEAINSYQNSLTIWRKNSTRSRSSQIPRSWKFSSTKHESNICRKLAMAYEHAAEYENALLWLDEADNKLPARPGIIGSQIWATRSAVQYRIGNYDQAIKAGFAAQKSAKKLNSLPSICYANSVLANSFMRMGDFKQAKSLLNNSLNIYKTIDNYPGIATSNYILGECCAYTGDLDNAIKYFSKALEVDLQLQNISSIAMDYYSLGSIQVIKGDFDNAIKSLSRIVDLEKKGKVRPDLAGLTHIYLCTARRLRGDINLAEQNISRSLKLLEAMGETQYLAEAQLEQAELYLAQGKPKDSKSVALDVLDRSIDSNAKPLLARAYRILGVANSFLGEVDNAINNIDKSILIAKEVGLDNDEAFSIIAKTKILLKTKNIDNNTLIGISHAIDLLNQTEAKLDLDEAQSLLQEIKKVLVN